MTLGKMVSLTDLLSVGKMLLTFYPDWFDKLKGNEKVKKVKYCLQMMYKCPVMYKYE